MDTPGHVSEGDGQEEDENKWGVGGGEGKKRLPSKLHQCEKRKRRERGVEFERKE